VVSFGGLEALLEHLDRDLGGLRAARGRQEAGKRKPEGQKGAQVEISGVKRVDEGHRGSWSAACDWPAGGGGDTTLVPELGQGQRFSTPKPC